MEQSGCSQWQPDAEGTRPKPALIDRNALPWLRPVSPEMPWEEEVDHHQAERLPVAGWSGARANRCCHDRQQTDYTRTTQALPGGSRS
jgi:hypothetical protein